MGECFSGQVLEGTDLDQKGILIMLIHGVICAGEDSKESLLKPHFLTPGP